MISLPEPRAPRKDVTFAEHIAPLLHKHCQECHRPGTAAPFSSLANDGIVLDLANPALGAGHSGHFLVTGDVVLDLKTLTGPLTLLPPASGSMGFAIKNGDSVQFFTTFPDFVTALTGLINGTNVVSGLFAEGTYDSSTGNLPAELILVRIGVE